MIVRTKFVVDMGIVGARHEEILHIEVKDETPDEDMENIIEDHYNEWLYGVIDAGWEILDIY